MMDIVSWRKPGGMRGRVFLQLSVVLGHCIRSTFILFVIITIIIEIFKVA